MRSTAHWVSTGFVFKWDILLPFVVYLGQRRPWPEGLVLSFLLSHLYALSSSAPMGVFPIFYLSFFFLSRLISYVFYAATWVSILSLMFGFALLSRLVLPLVSGAFDAGWPIFSWYNLHLGGVLYNTLGGYVIYWCLSLLDTVTFKAPRENIKLGEDAV